MKERKKERKKEGKKETNKEERKERKKERRKERSKERNKEERKKENKYFRDINVYLRDNGFENRYPTFCPHGINVFCANLQTNESFSSIKLTDWCLQPGRTVFTGRCELNICKSCNAKIKVKCSHYRPGVAQRVGRDIALFFHDRGTRRE